jgi:glyceraldehyde 3-phosphate dehydrogenase
MTTRVAINGFGRIGRAVTRIALGRTDVDLVAINDLVAPELLAHLLRYDSVHGRLTVPVEVADGRMNLGGKEIAVLCEPDPALLPWGELGVDVVIESTGMFTDGERAAAHLKAGASRVLISAPATNVDLTLVRGVNDDDYDGSQRIVSNASCTTNCAALLAKVLHERFGIRHAVMNTAHAYTSDQRLHDAPHRDFRRARAAAVNIVPTTTGAARAVGVVLPALAGRIDGLAMRVPVLDGSVVDLTAELDSPATASAINEVFAEAAGGELAGLLDYSEAPLVSSDIVTTAVSCTFDAPLTLTTGPLAKVIGWYDNEYGFSHRTLDVAARLGAR